VSEKFRDQEGLEEKKSTFLAHGKKERIFADSAKNAVRESVVDQKTKANLEHVAKMKREVARGRVGGRERCLTPRSWRNQKPANLNHFR
jgi:hypothetical protein